MSFKIQQDIKTPLLRQDLKIYKGGQDLDGAPTWKLYDPVSDNYFKIGWPEFEIIQRIKDHKMVSQIVKSINDETTLDLAHEDVSEFLGFLATSGLLIANTQEIQKILQDHELLKKQSLFKDIFIKYIFLRIPVFKPNDFLKATYPYIAFLFTRPFFIFTMSLLALGIYLTLFRLDDFANTFMSFFSLEGIITILITTIFVKTVHEFGHAYVAHKFNVSVTSIGIILIVFYPLLYTETTNAWRMYDRGKRIQIAMAGLMAELSLAAIALLVWHTSSPGIVQNVSYYVAFVSLLISIFINLNPLMKFDGYYVLSDLKGIDNLQFRAIEFIKWKIRSLIIGLNNESPEILDEKTHRFLIFFGGALIIYRVFLYLGISAAIYLLFFKPLGFIMMSITIGYFVIYPVLKEFFYWYQERKRIVNTINFKLISALLVIALAMVFLPIDRKISLPAVLHAGQYTSFFAQNPARIEKIYVENGQNIEKGDILFELSSKQIDQEIVKSEMRLEFYNLIKLRQQASRELSQQNILIETMIQEERTKLQGYYDQREKLKIRAPFSGTVRDMAKEVHEGRWVNNNNLLARLVKTETNTITAYVESDQLSRIVEGKTAVFKPDFGYLSNFKATLHDVSEADTRSINFPELSSTYGGAIPADAKQGDLVSRQPLYILNFDIENSDNKVGYTQKGIVVLRVQPTNFIGKIGKNIASLLLRETSF